MSESRRKHEITKLLVIVIENSTIMPFTWYYNKYTCIYCRTHFVQSEKLKQHMKEEHEDTKITKICRSLLGNYRVKLDISDINCKLCPKSMQSFEEFLEHASKQHDMQFNKEISRCILTFKLRDDEMSCCECGEKFRFFSSLLKHMNRYHNRSGTVVCEFCAQGFISKNDVNSHIRKVHCSKSLDCGKCGKQFPSFTTLKNHNDRDHTQRMKCPKCPEVFNSKYTKQRHMAFVHDDKSYQFSCDQCTKVFSRNNALVQHKSRVHLKEKTITCEICGFTVFNKALLRKHLVRHDKARPYECEFCKKTFQRKQTLQLHVRIHTNDKRYTCKECGKAFIQVTSLKLHVRVHHPTTKQILKKLPTFEEMSENRRKYELTKLLVNIIENSTIMPFTWYCNKYTCFYCRTHFVESEKLKQHMKQEHEDSKVTKIFRSLLGTCRVKLDISDISCKLCPKSMQSFEEFLEHISEQHDMHFNKEISRCIFTFKLRDDEMSCCECGEKFRFFSSLLKHVHKYHNRSGSFVCEFCGQGFVRKANVDSHIRNVHSSKDLKCNKCNKHFPNHTALKTHSDREHTQRMKCPRCPEVLSSKYLKQRHLALVHDIKSYQFSCDQCSRVFTKNSSLVQHKSRVHLKEKTVTCEICGFKVFNQELLRRHMVRHDDARPYECEFCKKSFQRKKTLQLHVRIHTNDKRYACKECGKAFVQVTSLKLHVRVHHPTTNETWT